MEGSSKSSTSSNHEFLGAKTELLFANNMRFFCAGSGCVIEIVFSLLPERGDASRSKRRSLPVEPL